MLANSDIRAAAKAKGVKLWELAQALHISEPTITRRLRVELPEQDKEHLLFVIDKTAEEKAAD